MSAIDKIGIKVLAGADLPTGNVKALLHELTGLLDAWLCRGEVASIDRQPAAHARRLRRAGRRSAQAP